MVINLVKWYRKIEKIYRYILLFWPGTLVDKIPMQVLVQRFDICLLEMLEDSEFCCGCPFQESDRTWWLASFECAIKNLERDRVVRGVGPNRNIVQKYLWPTNKTIARECNPLNMKMAELFWSSNVFDEYSRVDN